MVDISEDKLGVHGDDFYSALMEVHEGLSEEQSHALNARLVLIMANQISNMEILSAVLKKAKATDE